MKGYGNSPYAVIEVDHYVLPSPLYTETEGCYWYQDGETGLTDFLFHTPLSKCKKVGTRYVTPPSEGYGGRTFTLNLVDGGAVDLVGPWSGGSYCANAYLPLPSIEVTFKQSRYSNIAGYMTWKALEEFLPIGWGVGDSREYGKHWPTLLYRGLFKKQWSKELALQLDFEYKRENDFFVPCAR